MSTKYKINYTFDCDNYYLPCEITHYTTKVYYSSDRKGFEGLEDVKKYLKPADDSSFRGLGYFQDPYVQLLNCIANKYKNICNLGVIPSSDFEKLITICKVDKCKIIHMRRNTCREINKDDEFELMFGETIIPKDGYDSILIKSPNLINEFVDDEFVGISIKKSIIKPGQPVTKFFEQNKGGNFISAPDGTIFYIEGASCEFIKELKRNTLNKIVQLECSFKSGKADDCKTDCFRHMDELMCFMPYGLDGFKIWFYDELDEKSFNQLLFEKFQLSRLPANKLRSSEIINEKIKELNLERKENLEKICQALFGKPYSECIDNFVFFKFYSYLPSVLNRTWYETKNDCVCLFPNLETYKTKYSVIIKNIMDKITSEMLKVKSIINPTIKVNYYFINVVEANELIPEGTVHCLIKQRFIRP